MLSVIMTISNNPPIFLIGYRGTGKSAAARELARRLDYEWLDADDEIELRAGKSIAAVFRNDGEQAFRDLETLVIIEIAKKRRTVVALGGGAVLREQNRAAITAAGPVVWLTATVETILERIAADKTTAQRRPSLTNLGSRQEVETILSQRAPIYLACATLVVDTEGKTPAQVADEIAANL
jgi:shikimate kinase